MLNDNEKDSRRFDAALQTRQFEIDLFWKRSLFFWGFIAAAFVAVSTLKDEHMLVLLVSGFGLVCSFAWTLVNRGSKYWQEQWEAKVEDVENKVTCPLFKKREAEQDKGWWLRGRRYSVTRLTIAVSDYIFFVWLCIFSRQALISLGFSRSFQHKFAVIIAFCVIPLVFVVMLFKRGRGPSEPTTPGNSDGNKPRLTKEERGAAPDRGHT
jgi:hypothetical protein